MKYIRGNQKYSLDDSHLKMSKLRLSIQDNQGGFTENIWVKVNPDRNEVIFQNDALIFMPFINWGTVIKTNSSNFDCTEMRKEVTLTLHPEAFDALVERKAITEDGTCLKIMSNNPEGMDFNEEILNNYLSVK
jgi:hypothetical protein